MRNKFKALPKRFKLPIIVTPILAALYAFGVIDEEMFIQIMSLIG